MANNNTRMVTLRSSDEVEFEVSAAVAAKSKVLRLLIEDDDCVQDTIPIYNVDSKTLSRVIEYCTMHLSDSESEDKDLKQWDAEFINVVDLDTLYNLLNAANYLDIRGLLDIACQRVADMIKGKSPEDQRKLFKIKNDFTPEEEEEIRRENQWAFEENA